MSGKIKVRKTKLDYIVVGQGIAGSWLSYILIKRGYSVIVINHSTEKTASKKAAGLYNPITGRKWVKTWMADELFPKLEKDYQDMEQTLDKKIIYPIPIYRPFPSISEYNDWEGRQIEQPYENFLHEIRSTSMEIEGIQDELGGIVLNYSGYVDLPCLLNAYRDFLINKGIYHEELFDYGEMSANEEEVFYKGWAAKRILFCEGPSGSNPYWRDLPFRLVRGETIDISCEMKSDYIINHGVFVIPKGDVFTVGSTYDHKVLSYDPQTSGIENLKDRFSRIYQGPFSIKESRAGIRPATYDRKPFIGFHKKFGTIGIFNGFGTKGVSLSPYFANHFVDVLEKKAELAKEVDVQRVD